MARLPECWKWPATRSMLTGRRWKNTRIARGRAAPRARGAGPVPAFRASPPWCCPCTLEAGTSARCPSGAAARTLPGRSTSSSACDRSPTWSRWRSNARRRPWTRPDATADAPDGEAGSLAPLRPGDSALELRGDHRRQSGPAGCDLARAGGGADRCVRGAVRRNRHRQGTVRARCPRPQLPEEPSVHLRELRGPSADAHRERVLRPRARRVHRGHRHAAGAFRARAQGHDLPRRDWRPGA